MANDPRLREEALFEALLALQPEQRALFLREACGSDVQLRANVEALLIAHEQQSGVLEERAHLVRAAHNVSRLDIEHPGDKIGRYKLLQQIGEGGCGVVYLAEQREPVRRRVALKVIKLGMDTKQVIARFEAERQALAMMDHPNIARVLEAGATDKGRPYFAMELVRGVRITDFCDQHQLSIRDRLELFIEVCQAVQHAHQKGVIHRDLKPSNILVAMNENVPVPKVIDFGIAKATEGKLTDLTLFTAFEHFIGTPAYMSPEQASLSALDVDTRSDIYSLGVLLYELLTGTTPFETKALLSTGLDGLRRTIREKEPPRPSTRLSGLTNEGLATTAARRATETTKLVRQLQGDVDWIVMKCLEKDRSRRYETANGLARDVQRYLANEPVVARPPSQLYRLQKLVRRNKLAVAAIGAVTLSLVAGLALSTWLFAREKAAHARTIEAQDLAEREHRRADNHRANAEHLLARERVKEGWSDLDRGDYWAAKGAFLDALRLEKDEPERASVHRLRLAAIEPLRPPLQQAWFTGGRLSCAALTQDGERLAVAFTGGSDGPAARIYDRKSGSPLGALMRHSARINAIEFSSDGKRLLTASNDRTVRIWDACDGKPLTGPFSQPVPVQVARFNGDGTRIITGSWDSGSFGHGYVTVWDIQKEAPIFSASERGLNVKTVFFSPDDQTAVFGCESFVGAMIDLKSGEAQPLPNCWCMLAGAFNDDGRKLIIGGAFGADGRAKGARVWDQVATNWSAPLLAQEATVLCVGFSPDGRRIAAGGFDRTARVWGSENGLPVCSPLPHLGAVLSVAFSSDGRRLLTTSADQTARVWDIESSYPLDLPLPHAGAVLLAKFSPDDKAIWTVSTDGAVCVWNAESQQRCHLQIPHDSEVYSVGSTTDGALVTCDRSHVHLWRIADGHPLRQSPDLPEDWRWQLSGDASRAVVSFGGNLSVWNSGTGSYALGATNPSSRLASAQFTRDGRHAMVLPSGTQAVLEINADDGQVSRRFSADIELLTAALVPDETRLIGLGRQGQIRIWDALTTQEVRSAILYSGLDTPQSTDFSPGGRFLLVLGAESNIGLWNTTSLEPVAPSLSTVQGVTCARFSPDGRWLVVGHRDGLVGIHNSTNGLVELSPSQHGAWVQQICFSLDGKLFATGSRDNTARVWEVATGQPVTPPLPHLAAVFDVSFTPDGQSLCTASADRQVRVWQLAAEPHSLADHRTASPSAAEAMTPVRQWDPAAAFSQSLNALARQSHPAK